MVDKDLSAGLPNSTCVLGYAIGSCDSLSASGCNTGLQELVDRSTCEGSTPSDASPR